MKLVQILSKYSAWNTVLSKMPGFIWNDRFCVSKIIFSSSSILKISTRNETPIQISSHSNRTRKKWLLSLLSNFRHEILCLFAQLDTLHEKIARNVVFRSFFWVYSHLKSKRLEYWKKGKKICDKSWILHLEKSKQKITQKLHLPEKVKGFFCRHAKKRR